MRHKDNRHCSILDVRLIDLLMKELGDINYVAQQ